MRRCFEWTLPPGRRTGLQTMSQVMIDKVVSVPREAIGRTIGRAESSELDLVGRALLGWLAI